MKRSRDGRRVRPLKDNGKTTLFTSSGRLSGRRADAFLAKSRTQDIIMDAIDFSHSSPSSPPSPNSKLLSRPSPEYFRSKLVEEDRRWTELVPEMVAHYLLLEGWSGSWANVEEAFKDRVGEVFLCRCEQDNRSEKEVDLLDVLGRGTDQALSFHIPFGKTLSVSRCILLGVQQLLEETLNHRTSDRLAMICPPCFGPMETERKEDKVPDNIFSMDGNFVQRHQANSTINAIPLHHPPSFIPQEAIDDARETNETATSRYKSHDKDACKESFRAADDKWSQSSFKSSDDTGLFAAVCRHDQPLIFANIFKLGEKLCYSVAVVKYLAQAFVDRRFGAQYDIACNFEKHVDKRNLLPTDIRERIQARLPTFHGYAHGWDCQIKYNSKYSTGFGQSEGEGTERTWCKMSSIIGGCRYMTHNNRLLTIEFRAPYIVEEGLVSLAVTLRRKYANAATCLWQASKRLDFLKSINNIHHPGSKYTGVFFYEQWEQEKRDLGQESKKTRQKEEEEKLGAFFDPQYRLEQTSRMLESMCQILPETAAKALTAMDKYSVELALLARELGDAFRDLRPAEKERRKQLLLIQHAKLELQRRQLRIKEELRPITLAKERRGGYLTGYKKRECILASVSKQHAATKTTFNAYLRHVAKYERDYPDEAHPKKCQLMTNSKSLSLDDPFWNDGFMMCARGLWQTDVITQAGI
ncbi:hypothetical protein BT69DRAFT_1374562 [Atractiella rhizophila]|nr:hypothetical protein BT69DRAFT_1374562 [Atractiella rhizophila]